MHETMYELLSYEPYESISGPEKRYVLSVLDTTGKIKPPKDIKYQKLFEAFYNNRSKADLSWLSTWIKTYKTKRTYPKLLKKMCYYYMLNHGHNNASILEVLGLKDEGKNSNNRKLLNKWNLYADYRKISELHEHISLPIKRRGLKQEYLTQFIQKVYFEAHKQVQNGNLQRLDFYTQNKEKEVKVKDLPLFVDVFGGTASVVASMNVDSSKKVVNDFDNVIVSVLYILRSHPEIFLERLKQFHYDIIEGEYEKKIAKIITMYPNDFTEGLEGRDGLDYYTEANLEYYISEKRKASNKIDAKTGDIYKLQYTKDFYSNELLFSEDEKNRAIRICEKRRKFIILSRNAWFYSQYVLFAESNSAKNLRSSLMKPANKQFGNLTKRELENLCELACYFIYYHTKGEGDPSGEPKYWGIDARTYYFNFLNNYFINLPELYFDEHYDKSTEQSLDYLLNLKNLEYKLPEGKEQLTDYNKWIKALENSSFVSDTFQKMFDFENAFFYEDSPYFLTEDYRDAFIDDLHVEMLDIIRDSKFKWLFSMQYFPASKVGTSKKGRGEHYIQNYLDYYKGFLAKFDLVDNLYYTTYNVNSVYSDVYIVFINPKKKKTKEIFVTNVDVRRICPYGGLYIPLDMEKFIDYVEVNDNATYKEVFEYAVQEYEKELTP